MKTEQSYSVFQTVAAARSDPILILNLGTRHEFLSVVLELSTSLWKQSEN